MDPVEPDVTVTDIPAVADATEALALLSVSAARDDLGAALSKRPRARIPSLTLLLVVLLVAGGGFIGGEYVGKDNANASSTGVSASALRSAFAGRGGTGTGTGASPGASTSTSGRSGFLGGGFLGGSGGATIGSVKLVDGSTLYVETASGSVVQVSTSPSTKITISSTGTVKDLAPGDEVIVSGSTGKSGTVAATSISQTSLGGAGAAG
jgi:hypothetical protein